LEIRTLHPGEQEALLDLLDGWELPDGWRGRAFFRRYTTDEPTFEVRDVLVAEDAGRLVSCVQIFPKTLRAEGSVLAVGGIGSVLAVGGIGSVFTRPEARGSGVAGALLERATRAMRDRGMDLSLLFATRPALYDRLGWTSWPGTRTLVRADGASAAPTAPRADGGVKLAPFDPARDLDAVRALHAAYSGALSGSVVRDTTAWQSSLRAGAQDGEDFWVARTGGPDGPDGRVVAYARAIVLSGFLMLSELGRDPQLDPAADALAALVARTLGARDPDRLARPGKPSAELRAHLLGPPDSDPALGPALVRRGLSLRSLPDPTAMLHCLDPSALAKRLGEPTPASDSREAGTALLRRAFPPDRFTYWLSDRF
jgi:GNAT superfamily N-acetyltransferase